MPALSMATSVPGAHRDAHVCCGKGRGVVDPVPSHRHRPALVPIAFYDCALLLRKHFGYDVRRFQDGALRLQRWSCCRR